MLPGRGPLGGGGHSHAAWAGATRGGGAAMPSGQTPIGGGGYGQLRAVPTP